MDFLDRTYTVFIVDPDRQHGEQIRNHLKKFESYVFHVFSDLKECYDNLAKNPDVIFLDMELPHPLESEKKGVEVLKDLKSKLPDTEVVMFTGSETKEIGLKTLYHGAFDFIVKSHLSHFRAEGTILNLLKQHKLKEEANKYKKLFRIMTWVLGAIVLLTVILYMMGVVVHDKVGGSMF